MAVFFNVLFRLPGGSRNTFKVERVGNDMRLLGLHPSVQATLRASPSVSTTLSLDHFVSSSHWL